MAVRAFILEIRGINMFFRDIAVRILHSPHKIFVGDLIQRLRSLQIQILEIAVDIRLHSGYGCRQRPAVLHTLLASERIRHFD